MTTARGLLSARGMLTHIFYNLKTILACVGLGVCAGVALAALTPPTHTAETRLLLRIGATEAAQEGLNGPPTFQAGEAVQRALESDAQIARSDAVLDAARRRAAPGMPADRFARKVKVTVEPASNVLRIAFTDRNRERALKSVRAIADAYGARRVDLYVNAAAGRQDAALRGVENALRQTEANIQATRRDYDVTDVAQAVTLAGERRDDLMRRRDAALERRQAAGAELAAVVREMRRATPRLLDSREQTNATPNDEARNTLLTLRQERAHLVQQYREDWPGLAEIDAKIAVAQAQIVENGADIRTTDRTVRNPVVDTLAGRRAALNVELALLARQVAALDQQLIVARDRSAALRDAEMRLHELERSRTASETIQRSLLIGRAGAALEDRAVDDRNATIRVLQPPSAPDRGRDLRPTLVLGGLLMGVALAIAAATVRTVLRQTFITPGEVEASLDLPALATLEESESDARTANGREAARRLAGVLDDLTVAGRRAAVIEVIGEAAPERSRAALGLAQAMAEGGGGASAPPVLLIDPDAALHYRRQATGDIRQLPMGARPFEAARSRSGNLWVALDADAAIRGTADAARADLEVMRRAFGRVILVGPSDVEGAVARRFHALSDASVLLVRAEATRAPVARRLRDAVAASGGALAGFVMTHRRRVIPEAIYRWL